ncbi:hypothetical protein [Ornithinimicrobium sp. W1665]|uniref:hypothetical protein n=1 Tax=Ornithinimicrobium sp. W1665 TaxID=3416666 RepID=UPI003CF668C8
MTVDGEGQRLSGRVAWTVVPAGPGTRVGRWAGHLAAVLLQTLGAAGQTGSGGTGITAVGDLDRLDPRVGTDPLGRVLLRGTGPGLPDGRGPWRASVRTGGLTLDAHPSDTDPVDLDLPLRRWRLVEARPLGRAGRWPKDPHARWRLHLAGAGYDVTVEGTWVLLAHLGTVASWPQP